MKSVRVRHHDHVDAGVDGDLDRVAVVAGRHAVDRLPVADDEASERQLALQHVGDEVLVPVHVLGVPARVRDHHAAHARLDRRRVAGQVDAPQILLGDLGVALILAAQRAAVGQEVLGGGEDGGPVGRLLEPAHGGRAQALGQLGRLAVALVGAAPALVARDRDAGREVPVQAGACHLARRDARSGLHGRRIARAAHPDVVGEDRRALDRSVAVDGIHAVEHRDPEPRRQRLALIAVVHLDPGGGLIWFGQRVRARQNRTKHESANFRAVFESFHIGLSHLADFFVQRHLRQQRLDVG